MNSSSDGARQSVWWTVAAIFVVAVGFNYLWELAQSPLYAGMEDFTRMWWHCLLPSLGDGLLVLLIFATGWVVLGRQDWFLRPGVRGYAVMLTAGLVIAVAVEWVAVRLLGHWSYSERMPVVPLLNIGLSAVAQMLLLPPLIFRVVAAWHSRTAANDLSGDPPER